MSKKPLYKVVRDVDICGAEIAYEVPPMPKKEADRLRDDVNRELRLNGKNKSGKRLYLAYTAPA